MRTRNWRVRRLFAVLLAPLMTFTFLSLLPARASAAGLSNGGFESGDFTSWTLRKTGPAPIIDSVVAHTGAYAAYLGSSIPSGNADSQIMQTVAVPAGGATTLDLEWYPYSAEYVAQGGTAGCMTWDWQDVLVFDETGTTLGAGLGVPAGLLMHTCSNAQTWQPLSFDLSPWAGMTVALVFGVKQDSSIATSMRVDDIVVSNVATGTSTALASNHNPSVFGQSVDLTATVSPDTGSAVPTGTVQFLEGSTLLDEVPLIAGVATLTKSNFSVDSHSVIAKYLPATDNGFTASESTLPLLQVVNKAATTTTINSVTPASPTYGQTLSFTTTVAPVAPGAGTPTGAVAYKVHKFPGTPQDSGQYEAYNPGTDLLPAGTHHVEAYYPGDDNFVKSQSNAFVVTVNQATTTVAYLGDYLAITGNAFMLKAMVDSSAAGCENGREVTFTLNDGTHTPITLTAPSGPGGVVSKSISNVDWLTGTYDVLVEVAGTDNCTAADNELAADVITVASPGAAATGGGWYFWKESGAAKRVNFGFTVSQQADKTYKGSLLLMNQGAWRLKGNLDSFTRADAQGQAGGTGTLSQWVCTNQSDPLTCSWQNPRAVSFKITFTDQAAGKAGAKKTVIVDQFALSQLSLKGSTLPVSPLMPLKGGNIVLR